MNARIYEFPSGRRIDNQPEPSPDTTPNPHLDTLHQKLATAEAVTNHFRRRLGLPLIERCVSILDPGEGQLSIEDINPNGDNSR